MDAQGLLKKAAKTAVVVKAASAGAGMLAETIEKKSELLAEALEKQSGALVKGIERKTVPIAKAVESKATPIAKAVEVKADALGETVGEAGKTALKSIKGFRPGRRGALLLGILVGVLAVFAISRRIDRQAAKRRLRAAGARVGEGAQGLSAKVTPAVSTLTSKAGELTSKAGEKAGQVAGQVRENVTHRASELVGQLRPANGRDEGGEQPAEFTLPPMPAAEETRAADLDEARQRLSAEVDTAAAPEASGSEVAEVQAAAPEATAPDTSAFEAALAAATASEGAGSDAGEAAPATGDAGTAPAGQTTDIKVSNGMKVVAFDGTDIGRVQETREDVFVLDRPRGSDLLVPLDQVASVEGTVVRLRIETGQVTKMGWEKGDPS